MGLKPVRVGQLNNYISRILRTDPVLGNVSVIGEISNLKFHSSGHVYFSLKDEDSKVNCFIGAGNLDHITCPIEEGMEIIAYGYISVYERGGYYSLNIRDIEINGAGQLAVQFEKMKEKLKKEGLFNENNKKKLPFFPKKIAVVTSETGAAVKDIVKTIKNKNNYVDIILFPALVQGPSAALDISQTLDIINKNYADIDVIITGRGGGSMEELWAFNEEAVARSIFTSEIPIISAVGHETDYTIADFVADFRAATPTAAAELAVPNTEELREHIHNLKDSLAEDLIRNIDNKKNKLEALNPNAFAQTISSKIAFEQINVEHIAENMTDAITMRLKTNCERIEMLKVIMEASNPKAILMRGYSVVTDAEGNIICNNNCLQVGQQINIEMGIGLAEAKITSLGGK